MAFVEAYKRDRRAPLLCATPSARFDFVASQGWDAADGGGMWWNTDHPYHSGEALAADSLLGMLLYGIDHQRYQLDEARMFIDWGNSHDIGFHGLYLSGGPGSTVIDYIEAPLIYAQYLLCQATGNNGYCTHSAEQAKSMTEIYGGQVQLHAPVRLDLLRVDDGLRQGGRRRPLAGTGPDQRRGGRAARRRRARLMARKLVGRSDQGLADAAGMFRTMAGTTSLFAWLAYYS